MTAPGPSGLLDRLLGAALTFLLAAAALYLGTQLLLDVWMYLVIVGVVVLAVLAGLALWRSYHRGW